MNLFHGTTIVCVRRGSRVAMAGDGQVTLGSQVVKSTARKVRPLLDGKILTGFAGSTADAMTLLEKFENCLEQEKGDLMKGAVRLVKEWRMDKVLRKLEAMMLAANTEMTLLLSGAGDILEPEGNVAAIGSGGGFALAAGRALVEATKMSAEEIARRSIELASEICIYTNNNIIVETLGDK
ncbi:MAG: ATP-dependent protease subunit HslV [Synergistaceae bacterium]|nr:ATP-dependent protease subunit HslV [Synergistaceae bacterium]